MCWIMYGGVDEVGDSDVDIIIFREKFALKTNIQEAIMCEILHIFQDKES
jgi:hypothetical protein